MTACLNVCGLLNDCRKTCNVSSEQLQRILQIFSDRKLYSVRITVCYYDLYRQSAILQSPGRIQCVVTYLFSIIKLPRS